MAKKEGGGKPKGMRKQIKRNKGYFKRRGLYDGGGGFYAVQTDRWACEAHDLRELADRIEQLIVQASRR